MSKTETTTKNDSTTKTELLASPTTGLAAVIDAVERLGGVETLQLPKYPYVEEDENGDPRIASLPIAVVPDGRRLESLKPFVDEFLPRPVRIQGTAILRDERSFITHVNEMREPTTRIFCEPTASPPTFTAVYDYHSVTKQETQRPAYCAHRAVWPLAMSKEWLAWTGQANKGMTPTEFAEFLELRVPDVYWGDQRSDYTNTLVKELDLRLSTPSALIGLSRNLLVNVDVQVRQAQTLSTGEIAITYVEQHRDGEGQPIRVPNAFLIAIPVVLGGPAYQILARLRYRIREGKVTWSYDLHRTDIALDAAIREIGDRVALETGCVVFAGSPEK